MRIKCAQMGEHYYGFEEGNDDIVRAYDEKYFSKETKKLRYRVQKQRLNCTKACVVIKEVKPSLIVFAVVSVFVAIRNI